MRTLLRHTRRSVAHSPWQTLFLWITVFLSAIIFACIFEVNAAVQTENDVQARVGYGKADITVAADADSGSRYLSLKDLQSAISEEEGIAVGYFVLPLADNEGTLLGAATDLYTVGTVFDFSFIAYGEVGDGTVNSTVFVSESFAKRRNLSVGSSLTVSLLGESKTYLVQGINRYQFFGSYDLLLNAEGAMGVLSGLSPVFALFDGDTFPCSQLFVKLSEGVDLSLTIERINAALDVQKWTATECYPTEGEFFDKISYILMAVIFLFSVVIAGMLVGFSLHILGEKRRKEMQPFLLSGMQSGKIFAVFCIEILATLAVGTAAGLSVAALLLRYVKTGFYYATLSLSSSGIAVCCIAEGGVGAALLTLHAFFSKERRVLVKRRSAKVCLVALASLIVLSVLTCVVPVRQRWIFALVAFLAYLCTLLFGAEPLSRAVAWLLSPKKQSGRAFSAPLTLAARNNAKILEIQNVYKILCIICSVMVALIACFSISNRQYEAANTLFRCDYIVANAGEGAVQAVREMENTEGASLSYYGEGKFFDQRKLRLFDTEDISYVQAEIEEEGLPTGNGICISKVVARLYGLSLGDTLTLTVGNNPYDFVLTGYCGETSLVAFIDAKSCGFQENLLLVRQSEGEGEYLSQLTEVLSVYGAVIQSPEDLLATTLHFAQSFKNLMNKYVGLLVILSAFGCFNLVWVSYARRRKGFSDLIMVGMTRKDVGAMIAFEGVITLFIVAFVSYLGGGLLCSLLDMGMQSFGYRLY